MKNLIYTIAFDHPDKPFHQIMAKMLVSSIFRAGYSDDVLILTNFPHRVFEHGRRNLREMSFDTSKVDAAALGAEAQRFKFGARKFIQAAKYEKIMFVDCDCLCMGNPDDLFAGEEDIAYALETFTTMNGHANNAYLSKKEMRKTTTPGVNSGTWWVRAKHFKEVMAEWERIDSTASLREKICGDQPAWVRFLLDTPLRKRKFVFDKDVKYPLWEKRTARDGDDCVFQHYCGERAVSKLTHIYAAYIRRFHAETVFAMMSFLDG